MYSHIQCCISFRSLYPAYVVSYDQICGRVEGYQKGTADAFEANRRPINDVYVDGTSIILSSLWKHVLTYAVGPSDDYNYPLSNYPCAHIPGPEPPSFVGEYYYCESSATGMVNLIQMLFGMDQTVMALKITAVPIQICRSFFASLLYQCLDITWK